MDAWLDPIFAPAGRFDLVRLGRDHDGGYLVDRRSVAGAERLISFGVNDDWTFETDFRGLNPVAADVYDHTISLQGFQRDALGSLLHPLRPRTIRRRVRTYLGFRAFLRDGARHHACAIGYDHDRSKSLTTVLADLVQPGQGRIFVKIDIEGSEYRILDQIIQHADRLEGLAIELHDVDLHLDRIRDFLHAVPLHLCHVHANNYARIAPNGVPLALEASFTRHPASDPRAPVLPHDLDQPNNARVAEIVLRFHARRGDAP